MSKRPRLDPMSDTKNRLKHDPELRRLTTNDPEGDEQDEKTRRDKHRIGSQGDEIKERLRDQKSIVPQDDNKPNMPQTDENREKITPLPTTSKP